MNFFLRSPFRIVVVLMAIAGLFAVAGPHVLAWRHLREGRSYAAKFRNDLALQHLQYCLYYWPSHQEARILASRAARRTGDLELADQILDLARDYLKDQPSDELAFEWSLLRAAMGDLATVEESLRLRLGKLPFLRPLISEALAEGCRRICRMPEALRTLDHWIAQDPENAQAYFLRGEVHRQAGAVNRARTEYAKAVELNSDHRQARKHLVQMLIFVGRYQEALGHLQTLLAEDLADPDLDVAQARCLHDCDEKDKSHAVLDRMLSRQPDFGPALRERGRQLLLAREYGAAEETLRRATSVLPYDYDCHWLLFQTLQSQGKPVEAKSAMARAQTLKDHLERINAIETKEIPTRLSDPALYEELGQRLAAVGDVRSAERWLLSAMALAPQRPSIYATLANHYEQTGDSAKAQHLRLQAQSLAEAKGD